MSLPPLQSFATLLSVSTMDSIESPLTRWATTAGSGIAGATVEAESVIIFVCGEHAAIPRATATHPPPRCTG